MAPMTTGGPRSSRPGVLLRVWQIRTQALDFLGAGAVDTQPGPANHGDADPGKLPLVRILALHELGCAAFATQRVSPFGALRSSLETATA